MSRVANVGLADRRKLWGRSGNRCSWQGCDTRLTADRNSPETVLIADAGVVLGEEAHIRSRKPGGPRYDESYEASKLDSYENLLLLCPTHHTLVDKDSGVGWSVEELERIKSAHEVAVDGLMNQGDIKRRELDEWVAARLQLWEQQLGIDSWQVVSFHLNQVDPFLPETEWRRLFDTANWLLKLDWPDQYPRLTKAFENHRIALWLTSHFLNEHMADYEDGVHRVGNEHRRIGWNPTRYEELLRRKAIASHGIWLLTLEMTRSINLVIKAIQAEVDPLYRFNEGLVLMADGDFVFGTSLEKVQYASESEHLPAEPNYAGFVAKLESQLPDGRTAFDVRRVNVAEWVAPT